jgi:uncharacterized RDD family membrane protein YckC
VTLSNERPSWWHLVIVRPIIPYVPSLKPTIQWTEAEWGTAIELLFTLVGLVDALAIFRPDKRTIHDLIAGTKVIDKKKYKRHFALRAQSSPMD